MFVCLCVGAMSPKRKIPEHWTAEDRRGFCLIGKRRKSEHVLAFAMLSIGAQLFRVYAHEVCQNKKFAKTQKEEEVEKGGTQE